MHLKSWINLSRFLQFGDCRKWIEDFLQENPQYNSADKHRSSNTEAEIDVINFSGLKISMSKGVIYRIEISPLEFQKDSINLFGIQSDWIDLLVKMDYYDFLFFLREEKITSTRLFSVNSVYHNPIFKINSSEILVQFFEEDPFKFFNILIYFNNETPLESFVSVPI
jgi:hypothetical protein